MRERLDAITPEEWIQRAIAARFRVGPLARRCSVAERSLSRCIEREFHRPAKHWLRVMRSCLAAQRLVRGDTLKAIASDLGHSKASHLISEFKFVFGCTPREYRLFEAKMSLKRKREWPPDWLRLENEYRNRPLHPRHDWIFLRARWLSGGQGLTRAAPMKLSTAE